jgi:hypothetical protein
MSAGRFGPSDGRLSVVGGVALLITKVQLDARYSIAALDSER